MNTINGDSDAEDNKDYDFWILKNKSKIIII